MHSVRSQAKLIGGAPRGLVRARVGRWRGRLQRNFDRTDHVTEAVLSLRGNRLPPHPGLGGRPPQMIQAKGRVMNRLGLHARTAVTIVNAISRYDAEVFFVKDDMRVSAKSILGVLLLEAGPGTELLIEAEGEDEAEVMETLKDLFEENFGED